MDISVRSEVLSQQFAEAIRDFDNGSYSSRGLAQRVEQMTNVAELDALNDQMLSHTFWVARHLVHQPACWAPSLDELHYLYRCLIGDEQFVLDTAESYRQ